MAFVDVDSELMTTYLAATPIAAGSHHVGTLDEKGLPMLFALSNDFPPRLRLLRRSEEGYSQLVDMHRLLSLPEKAKIEAFHAVQSWGRKIYLAVAYEKEVGKTTLLLYRPFMPNQVLAGSSPLERINGDHPFGPVHQIYMSPISGELEDQEYPDIFLLRQNVDQQRSYGADIDQIHVAGGAWRATQQNSLPTNVTQILDISTGVSRHGQGIYALCATQERLVLYARFIGPSYYDPDSVIAFASDVPCPQGARCIASVLQPNGYTGLLVAGAEGITYKTPNESWGKDKQPGKLLLTDEMFRDIQKMTVVQDRDDLTLWFRNGRDEMGYCRTNTSSLPDSLTDYAIATLLLPSGKADAFAAIVAGPSESQGAVTRQMVIVSDRNGNITMLEQASDLGLWRPTPFLAPSTTEATEIEAHSISLRALDSSGIPVANSSVQLSASSSVSAIVNGRNVFLNIVPTWYECDGHGCLDFIIPTDSLASQTFKVSGIKAKDGTILSTRTILYDPSSKPMGNLAKKMNEISSPEGLKNMKTSDGQNLIPTEVQQDASTMEGAFQGLKNVTTAYENSPKIAPDTVPPQVAKSFDVQDSSSFTETPSEIMDVKDAQDFVPAFFGRIVNKIKDTLMDTIHWVKQKVQDVKEWVVQKVGDAWKFVCKIANEVKQFVLDCAEKISQAATWIWDKLKAAWKAIVDFFGFLFAWKDIVKTKNSISDTLTAAIGYGELKMDWVIGKVDGFFDFLDSKIDELGTSTKLNKQIGQGGKDSKAKEADSSTPVRWAQERLKNGGASNQTSLDTSGANPPDDVTTLWITEIMPQMVKITDEMSSLGQNLVGLFKKDGSINGNTLIDLSKPLLKRGLAIVRGIARGILKLVKGLLALLQKVGNFEINIPVFTWLYKKISGGRAFTLFDAISLIVAIPTTVFAKLITGKTPPTFEGITTSELKTIIEDKDVDETKKANFNIFIGEVMIGYTLTMGTINSIKLIVKMAKGDVEDTVKALDPSPDGFFSFFGIAADVIGCLVAIPGDKTCPGAECRHAISGITCFRAAYHTLGYFSKNKAAISKVVLGLDLLTTLANLGLSIAVGVEEKKAHNKWDEYDSESTEIGFVLAGVNAMAGTSYFTAFMCKSSNPPVSAIAAGAMIGTGIGTAILEGVIFKKKYDEQRAILLPGPPAF